MKTVREVFQIIDEAVEPLQARGVPLEQALGCTLAEAVNADADQPAYDRSAIDGFAVARGSRPGVYSLEGEILPGDPAPPPPAKGQILQIFTGSAVPETCSLIMLEDTKTDGSLVTTRVDATERLIRRRGSSVLAGTRILERGAPLGAGEIAILASVGVSQPQVFPRPRVLHITTGREIVPCESRPAPGQIRDSNGPLIRALLTEANVIALPHSHVDESVGSLVSAVQRSSDWDLLLISGGSSVGQHDRTPEALEALGFEVMVNRINSRPGKPLIIARRKTQWAFGLPGNPVSHFVTFQVFVARMLRLLGGNRPVPFLVAQLSADLPLTTDERETFWPARVSPTPKGQISIQPLPWIDSGDVRALGGINALIRAPANTRLSAGEKVSAIPCTSLLRSVL